MPNDNNKPALSMTDAEVQEGRQRLAREDFRRRHATAFPAALVGRKAATLSPEEDDAFRAAHRMPRLHWHELQRAQSAWEGDAQAVAARQADIQRVADQARLAEIERESGDV